MTNLPTGTVTFLFTDIEGSTKLVQALGEAYRELLGEHHRLMRAAFAPCGGIEVSTEGDAFFVVFTSAAAAVQAATQAQRALRGHDWGEGLQVRVRMGLHTGEGALFGDNYGGIDVHRAARIASAAHGGQVLLSEVTRALVEPALEAGVRIKDLGEHWLKDLDRPEHLYQLTIDGLPAEFPPPRSLRARPNNLPVTLTPFVARDRELREILRLLGDNRLVTLTGPGGTGKTRLALQAASEALADFSDGAFVVFLAPLRDEELVASAIAKTLGVREQGTTPIAETLNEYLADKHMLLVLDNFEQVLSAAPLMAELLSQAPRIKMLATSRAPLRISGEQEYHVPPMSLPDPARLPSLEALSAYEAVELFIDRARAVKPNFALTEQNARVVAEICWRLDGLPLAIELAAARLRFLGPQEILKRLGKGLALLSGGARDLPARQQTLRAAIAWSCDLLDGSLRAFFRRLSVFIGGWTFDAADFVCNPQAELGVDTFEALEVLTDNSLARSLETDHGQMRFRMLETIREYAFETLEASEDVLALKRRHALFFLAFVEEMSPRFTTDTTATHIAEVDHENLRAALRWAIDSSEVEIALRMGVALWRFWMLHSHLAEGRRWLTEALDCAEAAAHSVLRARALMALGSLCYWQNDFDATRGFYLEGLEIFKEVGDRGGIAEALYNVGFLSLIERDPATAKRYYEESRAMAQDLGDELGVANATWGLAMSALQERDWEAARSFGRETHERFSALDNWFGIALARFVFYQAARLSGDVDEAHRLIMEVLHDSTSLHDLSNSLSALEMLAAVEISRGRHERAVRLAGAADAIKESYGGQAPPPLIDIEDPRALARGVLGDERVEQLWREGRAMPLEEALAYARKDPQAE